MKKFTMLAVAAVAVSSAANADVYVHGKGSNKYARGLTTDFAYWAGAATTNASGAKQAYNWDGESEVISNSSVVSAYNTLLPAKAVVRCHSAGCLITARAIQLFGIAKFSRVVAGASAEGGSELANIGSLGGLAGGLNNSLRPSASRSFSHATGALTYHGGGSNSDAFGSGWGVVASPLTSSTLPGEDDGAVAYHSALGKASTGTWCDSDSVWYNPASYGCTAWNKGTNYSGHVSKEKQYWGHGQSMSFAARGW